MDGYRSRSIHAKTRLKRKEKDKDDSITLFLSCFCKIFDGSDTKDF